MAIPVSRPTAKAEHRKPLQVNKRHLSRTHARLEASFQTLRVSFHFLCIMSDPETEELLSASAQRRTTSNITSPWPATFGKVPYERLVSRSGHFNVSIAISSWWSQTHHWSVYHAILNLPWWQLLLYSAVYWAAINLMFGLLYYLDLEHLENARGFLDAFFLSVALHFYQTRSQEEHQHSSNTSLL